MSRSCRLPGDSRGASTLEFALASPVLIALFIGIAQLGLGFYAAAGMKHAVAEGARYATIYPLRADHQHIVDYYLNGQNIEVLYCALCGDEW